MIEDVVGPGEVGDTHHLVDYQTQELVSRLWSKYMVKVRESEGPSAVVQAMRSASYSLDAEAVAGDRLQRGIRMKGRTRRTCTMAVGLWHTDTGVDGAPRRDRHRVHRARRRRRAHPRRLVELGRGPRGAHDPRDRAHRLSHPGGAPCGCRGSPGDPSSPPRPGRRYLHRGAPHRPRRGPVGPSARPSCPRQRGRGHLRGAGPRRARRLTRRSPGGGRPHRGPATTAVVRPGRSDPGA